MPIDVSKVYNARIYINGNDLAGKAKEVDLPKIKPKFTDISGLGLYGEAEVPIGMEKMEARLLMNSVYPEFVKIVSNPRKQATIIVRSSMTGFSQDGVQYEKPLKAELRGFFKESDVGKFKQGDSTEAEATMSVNYFKLELDGQPVVEVDVFNNIYKVEGEDLLQEFRQNLGG